MKTPVFIGSCTAMVTPFGADGPNMKRMDELLKNQERGGTCAVVIAGTTGENATLTPEEYARIAEYCVSRISGSMKVILGVGGNNTAECLRRARYAKAIGADAVLMTAPYYNKTTQAGLIRHFETVADGAEVPLILYNVPGRTAIGIAEDSFARLAEHPNINGVKEASGDVSLAGRILARCGDKLHLWSGNDDLTVPLMAMGAKGVVSVLSNLIPAETARLCRLCGSGDFAAARALYARYAELCRLLFVETNPIPVKAAMEMLGTDSGTLRLPLVPLSEKNREKMELCLKKIGLLT